MRTRSRSCVQSTDITGAMWVLEAYWKANLDLASGGPELDMYDRNWPIPPTMNHYLGEFIGIIR